MRNFKNWTSPKTLVVFQLIKVRKVKVSEFLKLSRRKICFVHKKKQWPLLQEKFLQPLIIIELFISDSIGYKKFK